MLQQIKDIVRPTVGSVMAGFQNTIDSLAAIVARNTTESERITEDIKVQVAKRTDLDTEADQAAAIANKLRGLINA